MRARVRRDGIVGFDQNISSILSAKSGVLEIWKLRKESNSGEEVGWKRGRRLQGVDCSAGRRANTVK
jgi:hypothetical protein